MDPRPSAFTLVELLTCLGVVAALAMLAMAGYGRIVLTGKAARATSEMRQIGQAFLASAAENDGRLPQSSHQGRSAAWKTIIRTTLPRNMLHSPLDDTDRPSSYAMNDYLTAHPFGAPDCDFSRLQGIPAPSQTMMLGILSRNDRNSDHFHFASSDITVSDFAGQVWVDVIAGDSLYLFVDGHVERIPWSTLQKTLTERHTRFVRPDGGAYRYE
jgi:prepilin-type N-terminal cleavage/methylation domain-containing protein